MKINIDMLEKSIGIALSLFKEICGNNIEIDADYYWTLSHPKKVDLSHAPELEVGSLSDHLDAVEKLARGEIDPYPLLLRDLGEVMKQCGEVNLEIKR